MILERVLTENTRLGLAIGTAIASSGGGGGGGGGDGGGDGGAAERVVAEGAATEAAVSGVAGLLLRPAEGGGFVVGWPFVASAASGGDVSVVRRVKEWVELGWDGMGWYWLGCYVVVWHIMVWHGMFGVVWSGMLFYDMAHCVAILCEAVYSGFVRHYTAQCTPRPANGTSTVKHHYRYRPLPHPRHCLHLCHRCHLSLW